MFRLFKSHSKSNNTTTITELNLKIYLSIFLIFLNELRQLFHIMNLKTPILVFASNHRSFVTWDFGTLNFHSSDVSHLYLGKWLAVFRDNLAQSWPSRLMKILLFLSLGEFLEAHGGTSSIYYCYCCYWMDIVLLYLVKNFKPLTPMLPKSIVAEWELW